MSLYVPDVRAHLKSKRSGKLLTVCSSLEELSKMQQSGHDSRLDLLPKEDGKRAQTLKMTSYEQACGRDIQGISLKFACASTVSTTFTISYYFQRNGSRIIGMFPP